MIEPIELRQRDTDLYEQMELNYYYLFLNENIDYILKSFMLLKKIPFQSSSTIMHILRLIKKICQYVFFVYTILQKTISI